MKQIDLRLHTLGEVAAYIAEYTNFEASLEVCAAHGRVLKVYNTGLYLREVRPLLGGDLVVHYGCTQDVIVISSNCNSAA